MYVQCHIETPSGNHCCSGKAIIITYSECVFVALGVQHAMRMRHIAVCGLSGSTFFSRLIHDRIFEEKIIEPKMCFHFFTSFCLKYLSL
jgi:hypothetical protein